MDWIREHPYLSGGLVLGLIVLYLLFSSSSSSSAPASTSNGVGGTGLSSSDYASLQEAQLASATSLQSQQTQANTQISQYNAELAATQIQANAQVTADSLQSQDTLQSTLVGGQVAENTNSYAYQTAVAQVGGQTTLATIQANEAISADTTQAQSLEDEYNSAVSSQQIISDAQTQQATLNAQTQQSIANSAAAVQLNNTNQAAGVQLAGIGATNLQTQTAGAIDLANIGAQESTTNNQIMATENVANNTINAQQAIGISQVPVEEQQVSASENEYNQYLSKFGAGKEGVVSPAAPGSSSGAVASPATAPGNTIGGILSGIGSALFGAGAAF